MSMYQNPGAIVCNAAHLEQQATALRDIARELADKAPSDGVGIALMLDALADAKAKTDEAFDNVKAESTHKKQEASP